MNPRNSIWLRLASLARRAPADARDVSAPHGFSTRVVALAFARVEPSFSAMMSRLSWRALAVAAVVMAVSVAANFKPLIASVDSDAVSALSDPVGEWLNLS